VLAPLRLEQAMLRHPDARLLHTGMGPGHARVAAARALALDARAVAIAGVCAAVSPALRPGDVVCADAVRRVDGDSLEVPSAPAVARILHRRGLRVHLGPVLSADHLMKPAERKELEGSGILAVDMESSWLAEGAGGRPLAVVRVVADGPGRFLADPRMLVDGPRALKTLWKVSDGLVEWAAGAEAPALAAHGTTQSRQTAAR
jgi:4-hydroxy-3-methylbut-2-enyl diphosphate reductase